MNKQRISKPDYSNPNELSVSKIFFSIQGEGPFVGMPAVFIRLAGCNLMCPACDTEYQEESILTTEQIVDMVGMLYPTARLIVITGGEPFRQDISVLVYRLRAKNYIVQIETNGTLCPAYVENLDAFIVCSPKGRVNPGIFKKAFALKYVVSFDDIDRFDGLPNRALLGSTRLSRPPEDYKGTIYIQPMDLGNSTVNERNLQAAIKSCMNFGYILCLQMHKIINME